MFLAFHIPRFSLQARLRHRPGWRCEAVALLESPGKDHFSGSLARREKLTRIAEMTAAAAAAGVETGMTASQGQARCAHLCLLSRDPEDERGTQDLLLETAAGLSADFEFTTPGLVTIDLGAAPAAHKASLRERLGHELVSRFAEQHELETRAGFAPNPDLAALAARTAADSTAAVRVFDGSPVSIRDQLASLPLDVIDPPSDYRGILLLWGIQTLGEFTALPRDEVAERLGPDAAELWDRAAGKRRRLLRLVRPPADFTQEIDLEDEIRTLEPLLFLLRRGLETLSARLAAAYLAASEIRLTLRLGDGSREPFAFRVPDPSRDIDLLFRIVQTRLEEYRSRQPITGFRMELAAARPGAQPFHLFESTLRDPNRFSETLARLEALLGRKNAGSPVPLDTHRPDAFEMKPFDPELPAARQGQVRDLTGSGPPPPPAGLPLRRFRPPLPLILETRRDHATGLQCPREIVSGRIRGCPRRIAGPWNLSGDWWQRDTWWTRQEWDIQMDDGCLYRIACLDQRDSGGEKEWVLEGVYG